MILPLKPWRLTSKSKEWINWFVSVMQFRADLNPPQWFNACVQ
jgi:hypothetical protein